jgi:hypothetical protein
MRIPHRTTQSLAVCIIAIISALTFPICAQSATEQLSCEPSSLNFRNVQVGYTETQLFYVTNSGSSSTTISAINVTNAAFRVSTASMPIVLGAGQSVGVNVTFAPSSATWVGGYITFTSNASNSTLRVSIQGSGVGDEPVAAQPSGLSFGQVAVGTSLTRTVVLTSTVSYNETLQSIQTSGTGFSVTAPAMPFVLIAGKSVSLNVTFSPKTAGAVSGDLFVSGPYFNIPLSGSGTSSTATGQLSVSPSTLNVGSVVVGSSATASASLTASGASVTISSASSNSSAFSINGVSLPLTIAAGQSVPFTVKFTPTTTGTVSATVAFSSNGQTSTTTESLTGTGTAPVAQLTLTPTSVSFGSVVLGSSGSASGTLSASGAGVTVSAASTNNSQFTVSGLSLPVTIPAGQSVPFTVKYTPTTTGSASASLTFTSNAQTTTTTESLSGSGTAQAGQLTVSPSTLSFGNVDVGSNATQASTLSASGASVTISSATMSNSQFALSGASFPLALNAGQTAELYIVFSPTTSVTDSGTLTINSNASNAKASESLSGTGVTPQHSVSLRWNASSSSVAGYNIYRGTSPGAYAKINSTLDTNTAYTDSTVVSGVTYYYVATAVNSSGQESAYSTPIQVSIP